MPPVQTSWLCDLGLEAPSSAGCVGRGLWRRQLLHELILRVFLLGTSQTTGSGVRQEERAQGLGYWKQRRLLDGG